MTAYVITGKLGAGKSLVAVSRVQQYLFQGRKVATNVNLFPEHLTNNLFAKNCQIFRIPNKPSIDDLNALPRGHDSDLPDDNKNGILLLDECGTWFNSRTWNDKSRAPIIEWFRNARKNRWDIYFIIQDISVMDSQARDSFAEHVVYCRRFDRFKVPLLHHFGFKFPKLHMGLVKYGDRDTSPTVDRWLYRGVGLYDAYDTEQKFTDNDEIVGLCTVLPPFYTHGRYTTKWNVIKDAIKSIKVCKSHFFLFGALVSFFVANALMVYQPEVPQKGLWSCNDAYKKLFGSCDSDPIAPYEYYYPKPQKKDTDLPGQKPDKKPAIGTPENPIYIAGYEITSHGINMAFITANGEPYYPSSYYVHHAVDCHAFVRIGQTNYQLTCMPDNIAFPSKDQPVVAAK